MSPKRRRRSRLSLEADGGESAAPLSEAFEPEAAPPPDERCSRKPGAEAPASRSNPISNSRQRMLRRPDPPEASLEADEPSPLRLTEASDSVAPAAEAAQPDLTERPAASEPQPPPERTAAIYVLRHPAPAVSSNIVPIRPGALDALARETAPSFPAESVELSRSERDAFREIARALVGRAPASRDDPSDERAGADNRRDSGRRPRRAAEGRPRRCGEPAAPTAMRFGATPARFWTVFRSAPWSPATGRRSTPTGRCSISSAIAISRNFRRRMRSRRNVPRPRPASDARRRRRRGRDREGGRANPVRRRPRAGDQLGRRAGDADRAPPLAGSGAEGETARRRERGGAARSGLRAATFRRCSTGRATAPSRSIRPAASCR